MSVARTDDGVTIAYRTQGTGPRNLVFLHAWGASGSYFDKTIESLDPTAVRAITLDLRGHGDSDKPDAELTWEDRSPSTCCGASERTRRRSRARTPS